ncbi:MAG: helix-turn-helix transcriptional regulator, partial [Dehalococcoidia bacterium]
EIAWTERQRQVLDLLARGKTNPEIAEALDVSLAGAKWHVSEVISKLGVTSREEAAAWWRERRSTPRRLTRTLRGLVAMPLARIAGATAGVAAVSAGIAFVALPLVASDGDEPQAQDVQATSVPRLSVYSDDEVDWLAKSHAHDLVLTPYSVTTDNGRHLTAVDFVVLERVFQPGALSVESNIIGETRALERPMDVWTVRLALRPPEHAGKYSESRALVTFEDGTGILLGGGDVGALPFEGKAVEAARVVVNGAEFRMYVGIEEIHSSPLRALTGPLACVYDFDVRMPNWFGGGCDSVTDGPRFSGALHAGTSHRQGYAHAKGFVTDEVARIRLATEDGREVFVEPAGRATIDGRS